MTEWKPLSELPPVYKIKKRMFVVQAKDVCITESNFGYTSDPYCVWLNENGRYTRWPHPFEPTHFVELPQ